ncbi:MAG: 50S ribosomal protein L15 [Candidatus Omnitrophota bacterium]
MAITDYLVAPKGANKRRKMRGKGSGSGHGRTSCRGHKGQKAHGKTKGSKGFEGGQMPLIRRIPKRGFTNIFKDEYQLVNIIKLNTLPEASKIDPDFLKEKGFIKKSKILVKILGNGELKKKLEVHAHSFSKKAKELIEKAGGKAVVIKRIAYKEKKNPNKTVR